MSHSRLIIPSVDIYQKLNTSDLTQKFKILNLRIARDADDLETELENLALIREVAARIEKKSLRNGVYFKISSDAASNYSTLLTQFCYFFNLIFGILQRSVGSYLFGSTLFALVPNIGSPTLIAMSLLYVVFDSLLFYAFEVSFLKTVIGLTDEQTGLNLLNQIYLEQRQLTKIINRALKDIDSLKWNKAERRALIACKDLFNTHLIEKLESMKGRQTPWWALCLEYSIIAFGAFSSIVDSYFAFTVLHLSLLTPIGAIIALGMVISGLTLYYGMGVKSVNKLVNPDLESFEVLKEKLSKFKAEFGTKATIAAAPDVTTRVALKYGRFHKPAQLLSASSKKILTKKLPIQKIKIKRSFGASNHCSSPA